MIAFTDKFAGKRAHCVTCGQTFIIPSANGGKSKLLKPAKQPASSEPIAGFFRALFLDSFRLFAHKENATALVFVTAIVCFKFFLARACCVNLLTLGIIWGWLLGFYLNIIYETAFGEDCLPEVYLGTSISWLWVVIKPIFTFFFTWVAVQLPTFIAISVLAHKGQTFGDVWSSHTGWRLMLQIFQILGVFVFPMAILTVAVAQDFTRLWPGYLFKPIFRAFWPYLFVVGLLIGTCVLELRTEQFAGDEALITAGKLGINLLVQVLAIITMRAIGLFYRHYTCYFAW